MKIKLRLKLLFIAVSLFASCCPNKTILLSEDTASWIPYQLGNTYFFTNDSIVDTLEVMTYTKEVKPRTSECSKFLQEEIEVQLKSTHLDLSISVNDKDMSIFGPSPGTSTPFHYYHYYFKNDEQKENTIFHESLQVGDKIYSNVLVLTQDNSAIYYGKGMGIIGYKIGGDLFVRM